MCIYGAVSSVYLNTFELTRTRIRIRARNRPRVSLRCDAIGTRRKPKEKERNARALARHGRRLYTRARASIHSGELNLQWCIYMHVGGDEALVNQIVFIIYIYAYNIYYTVECLPRINETQTFIYILFLVFLIYLFFYLYLSPSSPLPVSIRYRSRFPFSSQRPTHRRVYTQYTLPRRHCRCCGGGGIRIHAWRTLHIYAYISYVWRRNDNIFICTHVLIYIYI